MNGKRFSKLMKRLSTGELSAAERRELDEVCASDEALRAEVCRTEAILAAAHGSKAEQPSEFEWATFSTRLRATIEAERPRPYGRLALWLERLRAQLRPVQVAAAALAVVVAVATMALVERAFQPESEQPVVASPAPGEPPEPEWQWEDIEAHYELAVVLPDVDVVALEGKLDAELDQVRKVVEEAPELDGENDEVMSDILGQDA